MKFDQAMLTRGRHRITALATGSIKLAVALLALGFAGASTTLGQFTETGGTIKTKDLGAGALDVQYFFESSAADNHGYLQVEVLTLKGPSTRERNLDIVLFANSNLMTAQSNLALHFKVVLPEGATATQAAIPFFLFGGSAFGNSHNSLMNWDVGVFEDDRDIEHSRSLNASNMLAPTPFAARAPGQNFYHLCNRSVSASTTLHLLDDGATPSNARALRLKMAQEGGSAVDAASTGFSLKTLFGLTRDAYRVANFRHYSSAPDLWQYYLQFRIVVLDKAVLAKLRATRPSVALALKHYVASGGNVILIGSRQFNGKELVDQWLLGTEQVPAQQTLAWRSVNRSVESWWVRDPMGSSAKVIAPNPYAAWQSVNDVAAPSMNPGTAAGAVKNATDAVPWASNIVRDMLAVEREYVPAPLSTGGVARDCVTAAATYLEAETGGIRLMHKVISDWLFRDGADFVDGEGVGITSMGYAVPPPGNYIAPGTNTVPGSPPGPYAAPPSNPQSSIGELATDDSKSSATDFKVDWKAISPSGPPVYPLLSFDVGWVAPYVGRKVDGVVGALEYQDTNGIALRPHVLGHVAVVEPDLTSFPVESLKALSDQMSRSVAVGTHSLFDEMWSYRNLIDSVGKPPVWTFCAIVLLFGLLLGPGLLTFTGWMRRRSLLIFLVPFISLVATLLIAVYEVLHEGFGTNVRISSVLAVDEQTGEGFAWSRQTIFSGWPPREGLVFPKEVYYRPVEAIEFYWRRYGNQRRTVHPRESVRSEVYVNADNSQWRGAVRSREQQQFLIGHPVKIAMPIKVSRVHGKGKTVRIQNLTREELPFVLVRDEDQGCYFTQQLAAGAEVGCQVQPFEDVAGMLSRYRADLAPTIPQGMQSLGLAGPDRGQNFSEIVDRAWVTSLAENSDLLKLPPKGFVTLMRSSDQIFVPIEATTSESTHLVLGRLVW